jgi:MipA family protein
VKHFVVRSAVVATVLTASGIAAAEEDSRWGLGIGVVASDNAYAGRGARITPIPVVTYDSNRFFFRGIEGGVHLYKGDWARLDAVVGARLDGINADDFGVTELANNGINRNLLSDRDDSLDAGFKINLEGRYGEMQLDLLADVLDKSGGFEAKLQYGYPLKLSENLQLTPYVGADFLSKDMTQYYYGILDEEIARGVISYKPDSAVIAGAGVGLQYLFAKRWLLMGDVSYKSLPDEISNSPLVDSDSSARFLIAVVRSF